MKRILTLSLSLLLFVALPATAQDKAYAKGDVFVGYSYLRGDFGERHGDLAGGALVSAAIHSTNYFSVVWEGSTHHDTIRGVNVDANLFLVGPRVYFLRSKYLDSFAHALFGLHNTQLGFPGLGRRTQDDTGFAFAGGAGFDLNLHKNFAFRVLQADYVTLDLNLPGKTGRVDQFTDSLRLASGIVIKWGE